jgi:hypothetical protein
VTQEHTSATAQTDLEERGGFRVNGNHVEAHTGKRIVANLMSNNKKWSWQDTLYSALIISSLAGLLYVFKA